jgi:hydrogenase maturation protease
MGQRTLIFGLGNPILTDDAIGWEVARRVYDALADPDSVLAQEAIAGLECLDLISGYDKVIIIDAIQTKGGQVGNVYKLSLDDLKATARLSSPHDVDLGLACQLGQALNVPMPAEIKIYAVEVADPYSFGEELSPPLKEALPNIVSTIIAEEISSC